MKEQRFNGFQWDPFLMDVKRILNRSSIKLDDGARMEIQLATSIIYVETKPTGFKFTEALDSSGESILQLSKVAARLSADYVLLIPQNSDTVDLSDRVELLADFLRLFLNEL